MNEHARKTISISLLSLSLSAPAALVPVLANISAAYPQWSGWVQFLITIPSLFMMLSSLFTSKLMRRFSLKSVTSFSILLIFLSGILPYFAEGFPFLLVTRGVMGIGIGLLNTAVASLPAVYFPSGSSRDTATGIQSAFISAGGIIFSLLSGRLAMIHWKLVFLVQLINLIPLATALFFMPESLQESPSTPPRPEGSVFVKEAMLVTLLSFVCVLMTCTYPLNLSVYATESSLGEAQFVSVLTSINSLLGFIIGLVFGKILSKTKALTLPIGLLFTSAGFFVVTFAPSPFVLLLGSVVFGLGSSLVSPALYARLYHDVPEDKIVSAVALLGIGINVSQFVSPFVINPLARQIDGTGTPATRFLIAGSALLLIAIALALLALYRKKVAEK